MHAQDQGDATGGVIPYKNAPALIAYYCGVFSIIPVLGIPLGIAGVVLGCLGLKERRENPAVRGSAHAWIGILAGGFFALVYTGAIVLMIAAAVAARR